MTKPSLIENFINEQASPSTAVEEFSEAHDNGLPDQAKYYQKLIPLDKPQEGQQYAFEVNLDNCSGCKACVTACHSLNGLDVEETWRDVGVIHGGTWENPFAQTITSACHHCVEPGCMEGCPVLAYDKDPTTGIVKHLDDQCIGCQYCTFKCPFDVPKYNKKMGIVRKCDMCSSRLEVGEAPACVQSCPTEAIKITIVNQAEVLEKTKAGEFLAGAPDPSYTKPTTSYISKNEIPENVKAADHFSVQPEHAHMPLVIMTILTQLSIGVFSIDLIYTQLFSDNIGFLFPYKAAASLFMGIMAMNAAIFHLGRPLYAFRAIIGLRTSWMSREILAFAGFAKLALGYALVIWSPILREYEALSFIPEGLDESVGPILGVLVALAGISGVFCSAMIYANTKRVFWSFKQSMVKFFGSAVVLGVSGTVLSTAWFTYWISDSGKVTEIINDTMMSLIYLLPIVVFLKLVFEVEILTHLKKNDNYLHRTALLLTGPLKKSFVLRNVLGLVGGIAIPVMLVVIKHNVPVSFTDTAVLLLLTTSAFLVLAGEFLERILYFSAVVAPKMPGGFK